MVRANSFTTIAEKKFVKTGSELKKSSLTVGLIIMGIGLAILSMVIFTFWRKRRKSKGCE